MNRIAIFFAFLVVSSCTLTKTEVVWYEGEPNTMVIRNLPRGNDWVVWFTSPAFKKLQIDSTSTVPFKEVEGNFFRIMPPEKGVMKGDSLVIRYTGGRALRFHAGAPEGFSLQIGNREPQYLPVKYVFLPLSADAQRVSAFTPQQRYVKPALTDMIPALKKVTQMDGEPVDLPESGNCLPVKVLTEDHPKGWYRLVVDPKNGVYAEVSDRSGELYAKVSLEHLIEAAEGRPVEPMLIEDWPDFQHRGLMLDPARHFVPGWKIKEYLRLMARYKLNVLHLHLSDDDGWRLEMPSLPQLTEMGAFRAIPKIDKDGTILEIESLQPSYDGTISRNDTTRMANGYYSCEEFKELLHFADSLCIKIVPEFDLPAHSRAIVHSVKGLTDPSDTSVYNSPAGGYHLNTLDVSLEQTYRFISTVLDDVIALYADAGIPLDEVHLGGDEVPRGAWMGSPSCHRLLESKGFDVGRLADEPESRKEALVILKSYFVNRIIDLAVEKDIKIAGWDEIAGNLDPRTRRRLVSQTAWINYWHCKPEDVHELLNFGFPVVLSNGSNTYADEAYSLNKEEFGNTWAGPVDEKRTFAFLPYDMYRSRRWDRHDKALDITDPGKGKEPLNRPENIKGVQVQLFMGAAIRKYSDMEYMIFPKSLGAFDRAWNAKPEWAENATSPECFLEAFNRFYSIIIDREMPFYHEKGMRFHIPQPVIFVDEYGVLSGYTPIPGSVIRYEFGDVTPTLSSPVLEGLVSVPDSVSRVKARLFYLDQNSVSTTLDIPLKN